MKIFFGSAIQGAPDRGMRFDINSRIIGLVKARYHRVFSEHTTGRTPEEVAAQLTAALGPLPPKGLERTRFVRCKMIEAIEGDLDAAIFEASLPSTGTGDEIAHAYLRPRLGKVEIPILLLYQTDYWPNGLSSMIRGLPFDEMPNVMLVDYDQPEQLDDIVNRFIEVLEERTKS